VGNLTRGRMTTITLSPLMLVAAGGFLALIGGSIYAPTKNRRHAVSFGGIEIIFLLVGLGMFLVGAVAILKGLTPPG